MVIVACLTSPKMSWPEAASIRLDSSEAPWRYKNQTAVSLLSLGSAFNILNLTVPRELVPLKEPPLFFNPDKVIIPEVLSILFSGYTSNMFEPDLSRESPVEGTFINSRMVGSYFITTSRALIFLSEVARFTLRVNSSPFLAVIFPGVKKSAGGGGGVEVGCVFAFEKGEKRYAR